MSFFIPPTSFQPGTCAILVEGEIITTRLSISFSKRRKYNHGLSPSWSGYSPFLVALLTFIYQEFFLLLRRRRSLVRRLNRTKTLLLALKPTNLFSVAFNQLVSLSGAEYTRTYLASYQSICLCVVQSYW